MNKGTIMTIDQKHAYVFTKDCRMVKIDWQPGMSIGKEITFNMNTQEETVRPVSRSRILRPALAVAFLAVVLVVGILVSQGLIFNPVYARLSIDVNPSVEFELNRQLTVLNVRALNEEAVQVLAGEDLRGLPWQEAVTRWAEMLKLRYSAQIETMLLSAVLPEQAVQFAEQLMNMEGTMNEGALSGLQVRVIYSKDPAVVKEAVQNKLSLGRQMLLNQAEEQHQNWNAASIADAPLGNLVQNLLKAGQADQTGLTRRETQSLSDPSGSTQGSAQGTTQQETNQQQNQETNGQTQSSGSQQTQQETNQQQNQETNGQTQGSQVMSGTTQMTGDGSQGITEQSTIRATTCEPSGSTQMSGH